MLRAASAIPFPAAVHQLLFLGRALDMTLTTDQVLTKQFSGTNYIVRAVLTVRKTGAFGTACAGGLYTGAAKAGTILVAAAQSYANLTGAGKIVDCTLAAVNGTDVQSASPLNVSLTTGNTGALTADFFVFGTILD